MRDNTDAGDAHGSTRASRLHVRSVALAQGKAHTELWVELRKLMEASEFVVSPRTCTHIECYAMLMPRGASLDKPPTLLGPDDAGPARARTLLAFADTRLLFGGAMS